MRELLNQNLPSTYQGYIDRNGTKNFKFWKHIVSKEKIFIEDLETNSIVKLTQFDFSNSLRKLKVALDNHCRNTSKKWCFNFGSYGKNLTLNHITLYIPELTVEKQDSKKATHTFKDFYIKIFLKKKDDTIVFSVLDIFRATFQEKEIVEKQPEIDDCSFVYHPHINSLDYVDIIFYPSSNSTSNRFCFGHGEMAEFMSSLPFQDYSTVEHIEFLLYSIEQYYTSESPEGGAYWSVAKFKETRENERRNQGISLKSFSVLYIRRDIQSCLKTLTSKSEEFLDLIHKCDFIQMNHTLKVNSINHVFTDFLSLFLDHYPNFMITKLDSSYTSLENYEKYLVEYEKKCEDISENREPTVEKYETGNCVTVDGLTIPINIYRKPTGQEEKPNKIEIDRQNFYFPEEIFKELLINYINKKFDETICEELYESLRVQ